MTVPAVQQIIDELDGHRARFEDFCRSLSPEELTRPVPQSTWLVRDFIAHLATIDIPVGNMFAAMHAQEPTPARTAEDKPFEVDSWNDRQVEARRNHSLEEVLAEAARTRAELMAHMVVLTDDDLARMMKFGGDSKRAPSEIPFASYLRGWCKHDPMHALDMSRALPDRQAALAPWFDDPVIQGYQKAMNG